MTKAPHKLNLGWVPYWNMLPLKQEISQKLSSHVDYKLGHPAEINQWTQSGEVLAAPCSSICLLKYPAMQMAMPLGVAASKEVQSVYIGLTKRNDSLLEFLQYRVEFCQGVIKNALFKHPNDPRTAAKIASKIIYTKKETLRFTPPAMYFSNASETSVALSKLLWRMIFGLDVFEKPENNSTAGAHLLIGDEALEKKGAFQERLDLAVYWRKLTGLPFVFAVMQSTTPQNIAAEYTEKMLAAAELAQARMKIEPSTYFSSPLPKDSQGYTIDLASYWRNLHFRLTPNDLKGLLLFLALTSESQPKSHNTTNKLISLQEKSLNI